MPGKICTFALVMFFQGCQEVSELPPIKIEPEVIKPLVFDETSNPSIHLNEGFSKDRLLVSINGKEIFSGVVTTPDDGTGHAKAIGFAPPDTKYELGLRLGNDNYVANIMPKKGSFILLNKDINGMIAIEQSEKSPLYD